MTSRERVLCALSHRSTDRCPIFATVTPQVADRIADHLGVPRVPPLDSLLSTRISHTDLLLRLGNDCVGIAACAPTACPTKPRADGLLVNEWGMVLKECGLYFEFAEHPMANVNSVNDLDNFRLPNPDAPGRFDAARAAVAQYGQDYAIVGDLECCMYETAWYLVGLEKFLTDLTVGEEYALELLDRVAEVNTKIGVRLIELGADILWAGDDFGTQRGMLMAPDFWRQVFKPRIAKMFAAFRKANPDIRIAWHSCGSILPIIPDFIEIGLDILNPIQPQAAGMDATWLKQTYGGQLCFFGGIDVQGLLPRGTPEEVRRVVREKVAILGKGGGYLAAPAHNIQDDTPMENILAMYEAVRTAR